MKKKKKKSPREHVRTETSESLPAVADQVSEMSARPPFVFSREQIARRAVARRAEAADVALIRHMSQNSLACTQNPLFVTSHGGLDMIFRDPTCPYGAVVVAVVVCVDVYFTNTVGIYYITSSQLHTHV